MKVDLMQKNANNPPKVKKDILLFFFVSSKFLIVTKIKEHLFTSLMCNVQWYTLMTVNTLFIKT